MTLNGLGQTCRKGNTINCSDMKFNKTDIETIDFVINQIKMNENCDSYGMTDFDEKKIMFDRADDLLNRLSMFIIRNQK